jgi:hypothetical protein
MVVMKGSTECTESLTAAFRYIRGEAACGICANDATFNRRKSRPTRIRTRNLKTRRRSLKKRKRRKKSWRIPRRSLRRVSAYFSQLLRPYTF